MRVINWIALASICLGGAGCSSRAVSRADASLPTLHIREPANGAVVRTNTVEIAGTTNVKEVLIGSEPFPVRNAEFRVPVVLVPGNNSFTLTAGTGFSMKTETIVVERDVSLKR